MYTYPCLSAHEKTHGSCVAADRIGRRPPGMAKGLPLGETPAAVDAVGSVGNTLGECPCTRSLMGVVRTRCGAMPGWATDGRASGKAHRRSAASCLARCAHCDPLPQPRSWRVRDGSRSVPGHTRSEG